jgi:hypothetical protein
LTSQCGHVTLKWQKSLLPSGKLPKAVTNFAHGRKERLSIKIGEDVPDAPDGLPNLRDRRSV